MWEFLFQRERMDVHAVRPRSDLAE